MGITNLSCLPGVTDGRSREVGHGIPLGDMHEDRPPALPASQPDGTGFEDVADSNKARERDGERDLRVEGLLPGTNYAASEMTTDSVYGSIWSSQQPVQSAETKFKINSMGQFVTVINHKQQNRQDEPSPTYKSVKMYGRQA